MGTGQRGNGCWCTHISLFPTGWNVRRPRTGTLSIHESGTCTGMHVLRIDAFTPEEAAAGLGLVVVGSAGLQSSAKFPSSAGQGGHLMADPWRY